ncbi:MAG: hypothetical protein HFJ80_00280 [Clostridiales bacterium]|nr:hypothetical protein [Clostridiales bacterium]
MNFRHDSLPAVVILGIHYFSHDEYFENRWNMVYRYPDFEKGSSAYQVNPAAFPASEPEYRQHILEVRGGRDVPGAANREWRGLLPEPAGAMYPTGGFPAATGGCPFECFDKEVRSPGRKVRLSKRNLLLCRDMLL